jgi:DNA (cytosine-5)-methyltransferase 1
MLNEFTALRVRAGLSIEDLALMTGYSARQVQRWVASMV